MPTGISAQRSDCRSRASAARQRWLLSAALLVCAGAAAQDHPSEYDVKSAYLLKLGSFVHFPEEATKSPNFDICIVGESPIAQIVEKAAHDETIDGRPVRVVRHDKAADARACAVVFLAGSGHMEKDLTALQGADALTVSDAPQFLDRGGMIQFVLDHSRVRFGVNLEAVSHTHLQLSSELLKVAQFVKSRTAEATPAQPKPAQEEKR